MIARILKLSIVRLLDLSLLESGTKRLDKKRLGFENTVKRLGKDLKIAPNQGYTNNNLVPTSQKYGQVCRYNANV
jgi:hypothetical protein